MTDVYDESGTLIATTHPIQAAQHEAKEKTLMVGEEVALLRKLVSGERVSYLGNPWMLVPCDTAALQPQVGESDEAVAREIGNAIYRYFTPDTTEAWQQAAIADSTANVLKREAITAVITAFHKVSPAILARHRQPAAVSADAVEYYKHHADNFAAILQKLGSYASGWHKPYLVSEIERFKQDVAMPYLHEEERKRAMSPETVCGGE